MTIQKCSNYWGDCLRPYNELCRQHTVLDDSSVFDIIHRGAIAFK